VRPQHLLGEPPGRMFSPRLAMLKDCPQGLGARESGGGQDEAFDHIGDIGESRASALPSPKNRELPVFARGLKKKSGK